MTHKTKLFMGVKFILIIFSILIISCSGSKPIPERRLTQFIDVALSSTSNIITPMLLQSLGNQVAAMDTVPPPFCPPHCGIFNVPIIDKDSSKNFGQIEFDWKENDFAKFTVVFNSFQSQPKRLEVGRIISELKNEELAGADLYRRYLQRIYTSARGVSLKIPVFGSRETPLFVKYESKVIGTNIFDVSTNINFEGEKIAVSCTVSRSDRPKDTTRKR